ncbi:UNVERIFIED_ORG: Flp pilus assembly protein TadD [Pseudomonas lini]|uniref:Tetratricopeptide repeat protein n=1 Tax=Pseudomonas viciae TaxID=2505979 RepID=A0A4P7PK73_9PSED|nr:tetratricopeptide repeat protein [Pseudomonas viciae]QBZ91015.1 tetratricopeptide repeat protein [Pseudomonas viciae]UZE84999.1 tetratricopeptide repeat protein [Pseudomonas viciae]WGO91945.1 tetratricopeptide repeat protein [Pseudomonas viciae]
MKAMIAIAAALVLTGCASNGVASRQASCAKPGSDQELALNLADDMANDGRLYASLANLEGLPEDLVQVRLRKARVLRLMGRNEAEPLYKSLLGTCLAADGEHGLGQLAAAKNDHATATQHLERAVRMTPTDGRMRNDLGVVYLNQRRIPEARFEFMTAMELKQSDSLAALNMVTLLIYQDNWKQAAELANMANLSPKQVADAQARAERIRGTATGAVTSQANHLTEVVDASSGAVK